jgi:antitoxin (DNA-binding transcriptional repressor) of toxin-antitoxin stability system
MTVGDMRLHWPKAKKALAEDEEILITRDSKPVARLLPLVPGPGQKRQRFDPIAHARLGRSRPTPAPGPLRALQDPGSAAPGSHGSPGPAASAYQLWPLLLGPPRRRLG